MTRSTEVIVTSPGVDRDLMWRVMATLIMAPEQYRYTETPTGIHAAIDQGLCALMDLSHAPDMALIDGEAHDSWCHDPDDPCDGRYHDPPHYLKADFDTGYAYEASCGCHSGGLHIQLVSRLGRWLDEQGATWRWYDESGDGWNHDDTWGSLGDPRGVCEKHRRIPAPPTPKETTP